MNVIKTARAAKDVAARFVNKHSFFLRAAGTVLAVALVLTVTLVALLTAPSRVREEASAGIYITTAFFLLVPMYFTGLVAYTQTDWDQRLGLAFAGPVMAFIASAMFTYDMPRGVAPILIVTALVGSATGFIAGMLLPNAAYRGSLVRTFRRRVRAI